MTVHELKQLQQFLSGDLYAGFGEEVSEFGNGEAGRAVFVERAESLLEASLMEFSGDFFHLEHKGVLPVQIAWKDLLLLNSTFSNDVFEELLKFIARNSTILIVIAELVDVVNSGDADVDSNFPEGCLHFRLGDGVGAIHVNDLEGLANTDVSLLDSSEESIQRLFLFVTSKDSAPSQLSQELLISNRLTSVQIKFSKQQLKLVIRDVESEGLDGAEEFIFGEFSTAVLIELFEVGDHGDVVVVDELDEPPEDTLEGLVVEINWLQSILDDLQLHVDVKVVFPQSFDDIILQIDLPLDVFQAVDAQSELSFFDGVVDVFVVEGLHTTKKGIVHIAGHWILHIV